MILTEGGFLLRASSPPCRNQRRSPGEDDFAAGFISSMFGIGVIAPHYLDQLRNERFSSTSKDEGETESEESKTIRTAPIIVAVLDNDSDPGGQPLAVSVNIILHHMEMRP